ncbi:MAG: hypothetical protein KAX78_06230, partial [Phycisphaerae bacterium]|nr:hypothetical protein [Phycisphaerae bacterium]
EILVTIRPDQAEEFERQAAAARTQVTRIGLIAGLDDGIAVNDECGRHMDIGQPGWDHFRCIS